MDEKLETDFTFESFPEVERFVIDQLPARKLVLLSIYHRALHQTSGNDCDVLLTIQIVIDSICWPSSRT